MSDTDDNIDVFDDGMDERFGRTVKKLRTERGLSQEQLALEMSRKGVRDAVPLTISRLESGKRRVRINEAVALSRIFNAPITRMVDEDPMLNTLSLLGSLRREALREQSEIHEALKFHGARIADRATGMLRIIEELRAGQDLDEDTSAALSRFEYSALKLLKESLVDLASQHEWDVPSEALNAHVDDSRRTRELREALAHQSEWQREQREE